MDDADKEAKRKTAYKSRLSRARTANLEKRGLTSQRTDESESMANMAFSIPVQQEVDMEALGNKRAATWSNPSTPHPDFAPRALFFTTHPSGPEVI